MICTAQNLMNSAKGLVNLSQAQLQWINTYLLCQILLKGSPMASCEPQELLNAASCFSCLSQKELLQIQVELQCEILNSGGTGGSSCLLCGNVDPTAAPSCDCAIYYNRPNATFFYWDAVAAAWYPFIDP
jgi:hypothetical protein